MAIQFLQLAGRGSCLKSPTTCQLLIQPALGDFMITISRILLPHRYHALKSPSLAVPSSLVCGHFGCCGQLKYTYGIRFAKAGTAAHSHAPLARVQILNHLCKAAETHKEANKPVRQNCLLTSRAVAKQLCQDVLLYCLQEKSRPRTEASKSGQSTQQASLEQLSGKIIEVYQQCGFDKDASLSILQMLTNVEVTSVWTSRLFFLA